MNGTTFENILNYPLIYKFEQLEYFLEKVNAHKPFVNKNNKFGYFNIPAAFDIETTSFRSNGKAIGIMYLWALGINGYTIQGRTWPQFIYTLERVIETFEININKRLIIYVHNLAFEFQFLRKWLKWHKVFANEIRRPIYAITNEGIEFRCSYFLSNNSLENVGKNLIKYKINKLSGYVDYKLIRHYRTKLTYKDFLYNAVDVKVVMAFIQESIENDGDISKIPLTKTGYVRNFCRNQCFYGIDDNTIINKKYNNQKQKYMELMDTLKISTLEYKMLKRAFQGGFTHANSFYANQIVKNVISYDLTSSYPTVMVADRFPMSGGEIINYIDRDVFKDSILNYCCLFDIEFTDICAKVLYENYITSYKCWKIEKACLNNGRIVSADLIRITITEQDFFIIYNLYTWKKSRIGKFYRYKKGYLPTPFVKSILMMYKDKTELKNIEGKEIDYIKSKNMINATYGMIVTDIVRDNINYDDEWKNENVNEIEKIREYNYNKNRFLYYPWGVWVTAYARRNLFTGIINYNNLYIYSDTDSVKVLQKGSDNYIENYNQNIIKKLKIAMDYHGLSYDYIYPKNKYGKEKPLGIWELDAEYEEFKTLGAKRYMYKYSNNPVNKNNAGKYSLTVSGLNKTKTMPYLTEKFKDKVMENFSDELYVPRGKTGKNIITYNDNEEAGVITDYRGITADYYELSGCHIEESDYSLSLERGYKEYIQKLKVN